jgi:hypothetical protein
LSTRSEPATFTKSISSAINANASHVAVFDSVTEASFPGEVAWWLFTLLFSLLWCRSTLRTNKCNEKSETGIKWPGRFWSSEVTSKTFRVWCASVPVTKPSLPTYEAYFSWRVGSLGPSTRVLHWAWVVATTVRPFG